MKRQSTHRQLTLRSQTMQPGGQAVLRKRCLYLKKNTTALEVITWLDSNKKYHPQIGQRFIQLGIVLHSSPKHFFLEGSDCCHYRQL